MEVYRLERVLGTWLDKDKSKLVRAIFPNIATSAKTSLRQFRNVSS